LSQKPTIPHMPVPQPLKIRWYDQNCPAKDHVIYRLFASSKFSFRRIHLKTP
jgi:hypothetical protein